MSDFRWLIADSLYCKEQRFCSHIDSYSHYIAQYGEGMITQCAFLQNGIPNPQFTPIGGGEFDVAFVLDRYDLAPRMPAKKRIAQVAAMCPVMPWDVRNPDGSPVFDCVISSIPWMVEEARARGCRAEFMALAFDTRALVAGMGVKERDIPVLFCGTRSGNHRKREEILTALGDLVTIAPPTFGRDYFRLLARARVVLQIHAEWSRGAANAMRIFESIGMGANLVSDGEFLPHLPHLASGDNYVSIGLSGAARFRHQIEAALLGRDSVHQGEVLVNHTYVQRIPQLLDLARSL